LVVFAARLIETRAFMLTTAESDVGVETGLALCAASDIAAGQRTTGSRRRVAGRKGADGDSGTSGDDGDFASHEARGANPQRSTSRGRSGNTAYSVADTGGPA